MSSHHIIRAELDQLDIVATLFNQYRIFYEQAPNLDGARQFIKERMENNESVIFLALDKPGGKEGLGFVQMYPLFSSVSMRFKWLLNDLYVSEDARQWGVGEALMEKARDHAIYTNAKGLSLETAVDNIPAQTLYEKLGWVRETEFYTYNLDLS